MFNRMPCISDLSQEYKWTTLQQTLALGGQPGRAAKGLIERAVHQEDIQLAEGRPCKIVSTKSKK
jgi:hypothetical protein